MTMLTGPIQPSPRERRVDRSDVAYTLWEQAARSNPVELPWRKMASFDAGDVRDLLSGARSVVAAGLSVEQLGHVVSNLKPGMRGYWVGPVAAESDRSLVQALGRASDRIAARLGYELPADWIVVDGGRAGALFVGPPGEPRRWVIPLEPDLARSLFEASRVLWWRHTRREGLPDAGGTFAFRPPLQSPFPDPGTATPLPAGRLLFDQALPDLAPDADFRVTPDGGSPGRAAVVLMPPSGASFSIAKQVAASGGRVVWTDCGLPRLTVSRQRLVMDLVSGPIGLQLEWDVGVAVDLFHRLGKICDAPAWSFHGKRRLRDVSGPAWIEGASGPAPVSAEERIDLGDVQSSLAEFETTAPATLPPPAPLSRVALYAWQTVPATVPQGAAKAQIIRQWTAVDEWTRRGVSVLQARLSTMEGEERGFMGRLKGWLRGQDDVQRERERLRDALAEIGEQPPSQRGDAQETVARLVDEAGKLQKLLLRAHHEHQAAEDRAEEAEQRRAFEARVALAAAELASKRQALVAIEAQEAGAEAACQDAEAALVNRTQDLRSARAATAAEERDQAEARLSELRALLQTLDTTHNGNAPKEERKPLTTEIARLEQQLAAGKRALAAMDKWSPPMTDLVVESAALSKARAERDALRKARAPLMPEIARLERAAKEEFLFRSGARLAATSPLEVGGAPQVPDEAPPDLGELFEHQGRRYLAVRTWEQVRRAERVAGRLRAELVAFPLSTK